VNLGGSSLASSALSSLANPYGSGQFNYQSINFANSTGSNYNALTTNFSYQSTAHNSSTSTFAGLNAPYFTTGSNPIQDVQVNPAISAFHGSLAQDFDRRWQAPLNDELRSIAASQARRGNGVAEIRNAADIGSSLTPLVSDGRDFYEVATGRDVFSQEPITGWGYILTVVGAALPVIGGAFFRRGGNAAAEVIQDGVRYIDDSPSMSPAARNYEDSAIGARSNVATRMRQVPVLDRQLPGGGVAQVKFDGIDGQVFIDRKLSVTNYPKAKDQAIRQSEALRHNGLQGRWVVPNSAEASRARKLFEELKIDNIDVRVEP
jgi:hypothetical protein